MERDCLNCSGLRKECVDKGLYVPYGDDETCIYHERVKVESARKNLERYSDLYESISP